MAEVRAAVVIEAPAQEVFAFCSDPANLPRYVERLIETHLRPDDLECLTSTGGWLRPALDCDPGHLTMRWECPDIRGYSGFLDVAPINERMCKALVYITSEVEPDRLRLGVDRALHAIKVTCETPRRAYLG